MQASTASSGTTSTGSRTVADLMALAAEKYADSVAVRFKRDGEWQDVTFAEMGGIVREIGLGLIDLGIEPGDRVCILCNTRPEWTYSDFAISSAGARATRRSCRRAWTRSSQRTRSRSSTRRAPRGRRRAAC